MFSSNLNSIDRVLRIIIGLVLISLAFIGPKTPLGYIGIIPIATAIISFCPIYRIFGLSTKSK